MKLLLGLVVVTASGCFGVEHVTVMPPPANATPDQRVWAYETYRPRGDLTETIRTCDRYGCSTTSNKVVMIADGRIVRDPDDLTPLVAQDSQFATQARRATHATSRARLWGLGMAAAIVGGMMIAINGNSNDDSGETKLGLGIALGGLVVGAFGGYFAREDARDARKTAFMWYPHDLAENLHLCWTGARTVPCESITPGAPPEQPRDPNLDQLRPR